jgi:hypothetical protein
MGPFASGLTGAASEIIWPPVFARGHGAAAPAARAFTLGACQFKWCGTFIARSAGSWMLKKWLVAWWSTILSAGSSGFVALLLTAAILVANVS